MKSNKKNKIKEIAKACNVSVATVSNIINHKGSVGDATRECVEQVIREMNYTPNYVTKNLKTKNTRSIGVIAEDMTVFALPDIYGSKEDFLKKYPFDETNPDSIISNLNRAYDNAIVLRESISTEALSYIQLAIYEMRKAAESKAPLFELQHVLDELQRRIQAEIEHLTGIEDVYPAMNPLGIDSITRGIPAFDLDVNRLFPGNINGNMTEYLAAQMIRDVKGSDCVLESTFAYSLNSIGTPVLVVEMGVGMRITRSYGDQLVDGTFNLMKKLGIWTGSVHQVQVPIISRNPEDVSYLNAKVSGIFIPSVQHGTKLKKGDQIGKIVDPLTGTIRDQVTAPVESKVFFIHNEPLTYANTAVIKLVQ